MVKFIKQFFCNIADMDKKREIGFVLIFIIAYAFFFILLAYSTKNYEFVYYAIVISSLLAIIVLHYKQLHLKAAILWGLSILGLMHLAGGTINIYGVRSLIETLTVNKIPLSQKLKFLS